MNNELKNASSVRYITEKDITFYETEGKMLGACLDGNDVGRVDVLRLFPLHEKEKYISVRKKAESFRDRNTELGIIEDISVFPKDEKDLVWEELQRRYFVPEITKVKSAKEEFGHTYWETETTAGERNFTTFDMSSSLVRINENSVMLIDVDGSRYLIPDLKNADEKAVKILDIWL